MLHWTEDIYVAFLGLEERWRLNWQCLLLFVTQFGNIPDVSLSTRDFPMYLQHYNNNPNQTHRWAVVKKIASEMEAVLKNYLHCFILFTLLLLPRLLTLLTLLSLLPPRPQPTLLTLHTLLREGSHYQFGWIFRKVPRGGGSFSIQKFILQILGTLNRAFWAWNW